MAVHQALGIVFDKGNDRFLVLSESGATDISRFIDEATVHRLAGGVGCHVECTIAANYFAPPAEAGE